MILPSNFVISVKMRGNIVYSLALLLDMTVMAPSSSPRLGCAN